MSANAIPLRASHFADWDAYYWAYQNRLAAEYLLPTLRGWGLWRPGLRILDVGCGNGGASCALAQAGGQVAGLEVESRRLEDARARAESAGLQLHWGLADITDATTLSEFAGPFDLILFRDVLEHIVDRDAALKNCAARLSPGGAVVVTYPPYWSAYGGHQQILPARPRLGVRWAKLPFAHVLPLAWLRRLAGVDPSHDDWQEIVRLRRACLTLGALGPSAAAADLRITHRQDYLLRPSFRLRYGTPVWPAGWLGRIGGLNEVLVMGTAAALQAVVEGAGNLD